MIERPRVQLIGDSIAIGYAPLVAARLADRIDVLPPPDNAGDSANLLAHLDAWVLSAAGGPPDLVHLNCGLHDLKRRRPDGALQQPIEAYEKNVRAILARLTAAMPGRVLWATITPVFFQRHRAKKDFDRRPSDVAAYNQAALAVAQALGVPVDDLNAAVRSAGVGRSLSEDGVHMNETGNATLAAAVSARIGEVLAQ